MTENLVVTRIYQVKLTEVDTLDPDWMTEHSHWAADAVARACDDGTEAGIVYAGIDHNGCEAASTDVDEIYQVLGQWDFEVTEEDQFVEFAEL